MRVRRFLQVDIGLARHLQGRRGLLGCVLLLCGQAACGGAPLVVFEGPEGTKATFRVEVADTAEERRWGGVDGPAVV